MTTPPSTLRRVLTTAAIALLALTPAAGLLAPPGQAISGGTPATDVAPYQGSLQRIDSPRNDGHACGATLIAPRWAITAGHCLNFVHTGTSLAETGSVKLLLKGNPTGWKVRFGSTRVGSGGRVVKVQQFVRQSRFAYPGRDIGLLKLSRRVNAEPAVLAKRTPLPGTRARIGGWGFTGHGGLRDYESRRSYPAQMRTATTQIAPGESCGLRPSQQALCVGVESHGGPDNLDNGGGVFVQQDGRTVLAGTLNGGNYVSGGFQPAIYTDVSAYRPWIRSYISGDRRIPGPAPITTPGLAGSAQLRSIGCSATVVRIATSRPTDHAMALTNGQCVQGRRPRRGHAYVDRPARQPVHLLGATSNPVARSYTTRLLYATMSGTDVAVYRLRHTYAELQALGLSARLIATDGPRAGDRLVMYSGYRATTYACTVEAVVPKMREAGFTQLNGIRYVQKKSCRPQAGTSGSALVNRSTGEVVAVHDTEVAGSGRIPCIEDNPCEVGPDGTTTAVPGRAYAQQVAQLPACLRAGSVFDAGQPGCTLPAS